MGLSGKKLTKLKGTTLKKVTNKPRKVNQNLFTDFDASDEEVDQNHLLKVAAAPKTNRFPIMKQTDAIKHVTARMSSSVFELIRSELPKLRELEKDLLVSEMEDDFELMPHVLWKAAPSLEAMLQSTTIDGAVQVKRNT